MRTCPDLASPLAGVDHATSAARRAGLEFVLPHPMVLLSNQAVASDICSPGSSLSGV